MFLFYLTKLLQFMLLPPGIFIILLVTLRKYKKFFYITITLLYLISTKFIANSLIYPLEKNYFYSKNIDANAVVILVVATIKKFQF